MPYIITTREAAAPPNQNVAVRAAILTEHAVATLDEARDASWQAMAGVDRYGLQEAATLSAQVHDLPEFGGTIGPLPDGTVIQVSPFQPNVPEWRAQEIVAAFNAR